MLPLAIVLFAAAQAGGTAPPQAPLPDAGAASADAGVSGAEVALTELLQVKELCAALQERDGAFDGDPAAFAAARAAAEERRAQALRRSYRLEVPSKGFAFGRYRAGENLVELDGDRPLRSLKNGLALDLDGIDEVAFPARPEQVSQWSKDKQAGALRLVVVFRLDGERCAGSAAAQSFRLSGHATSWQLVDGDKVVAAADESGEPLGGAHGPLGLKVSRVALDSDGASAPDDEGRDRLSGAQRALDKCAAQASRAGTLVIAFAAQAGRVRDPQVIVDALHDEPVAQCVARAMAGAPLTGAAGASGRGTASIALE